MVNDIIVDCFLLLLYTGTVICMRDFLRDVGAKTRALTIFMEFARLGVL